jgi:hypothetical protein
MVKKYLLNDLEIVFVGHIMKQNIYMQESHQRILNKLLNIF